MRVSIATLESLCELIIDCPHSTPKWTDEGYIVTRNQNIKNGTLNLSNPSFTNKEGYLKRIKRAKPQAGDIIFTREAPMGEVCLIPEGIQCCLGQRQVLLRPKSEICGEYLFWALQSPLVQHQISWNEGTGSTISNVRIPVLKALNIPRHPDQEEGIAKILSDLAKKIELNTQTNQTLEQIAQALFKSWFVDFDPVKAKIKARKLWQNNHSPFNHSPFNHSPFNHSPLEGESKSVSDSVGGKSVSDSVGGKSVSDSVGGIKRLYTQAALNHSKTLRKNQTHAEGLLWHYLRNKQLGGFKFRRQQPIGNYIVDFVCMPKKLIIELDGSQHADQANYDQRRDDFLRAQGFTVLRFWNNAVFEQCFEVLDKIYCQLIPPPHQHEANASTSATPPQGGSDLEAAMNLAAMGAISAKNPEQLASLQQSDPAAYQQLAQTAALFPSAMQDSEFGEIPEGWNIESLKNCITELRRGISPKYTEEIGIIVINQKCIRNHTVNFSHSKLNDPEKRKVSGRELEIGDVLVNSTGVGTLGRLAPVRHLPEICVVDSHVTVVRADSSKISRSFLAGLMVANEPMIEASGAGSTGQIELRKQILEDIKFALPPIELTNTFEIISNTINLHIANSEKQKSVLNSLRDTLLPKLLSGEIDLSAIKDQTLEVHL